MNYSFEKKLQQPPKIKLKKCKKTKNPVNHYNNSTFSPSLDLKKEPFYNEHTKKREKRKMNIIRKEY